MESWMIETGLLAGLFLLAYSLFQFSSSLSKKLASWLVLGTIGTALYFWTDSLVLALAAVSMWFVFPICQVFIMSRKLRYSSKRSLKQGALNVEEFPEVHELSSHLRKVGFLTEGDHWLKPSPHEQGFRLLRHREKPVFATVALTLQGNIGLVYTIFGSQARDGSVWITWNYPLAYGLEMPPHFKVFRCLETSSSDELYERHEAFLKLNDVDVAPNDLQPENGQTFFEEFFRTMMSHNLSIGLLKSNGQAQEDVHYSWRGTLFIMWQVFREMVFG
ncbi:MAG: hypothetical protein AAF984_00770 [Verrucomicrobiota bacterium]